MLTRTARPSDVELCESASPASPVRDPHVLEVSRSPRRIERRLQVSDDLAFLQGHFAEFPVVAGVVQLRWVMQALEELTGEKARGGVLEALKFPRPLLPGRAVSVEVELADSGDFVRFRVYEGRRTFASGRWRSVRD